MEGDMDGVEGPSWLTDLYVDHGFTAPCKITIAEERCITVSLSKLSH